MDTHARRFDAIVVGGGISGLVTAFELQRRGRRVALIDAGKQPGGVLASHRDDGFLYETAANSVLDSNAAIARLLDVVGVAGERVDASPVARNRYVVRDGRLVALPSSPSALVATRAFGAHAKLRLLREPFVPPAPADDDESVAAFARRRFGSEILDYGIDPFVSGVHAGDPERLSIRAAFPKLHGLEQRHGSVIRGLLASARERRGDRTSPGAPKSFSFVDGMQALPNAIAGRIEHYLAGVEVGSIDVAEPPRLRALAPGIDVTASAIVVCVPAEAAAALVARLSGIAAETLRSIGYAPVAIVASAYRRSDVTHALDGFGFLAPRVEQRAILGSLFSSSLFPNRAPEGFALFTTFIGGEREPQAAALDDAALESRVATELAALVGARTPRWARIVRWPRAIPQYTLGHVQRVAAVDTALAHVPGLFFCANWRGGVAVGDCIQQAHDVAARVDAHLQAST